MSKLHWESSGNAPTHPFPRHVRWPPSNRITCPEVAHGRITDEPPLGAKQSSKQRRTPCGTPTETPKSPTDLFGLEGLPFFGSHFSESINAWKIRNVRKANEKKLENFVSFGEWLPLKKPSYIGLGYSKVGSRINVSRHNPPFIRNSDMEKKPFLINFLKLSA